jgi:predicted ATPase/DNA-binding SARP family transcriptional activator
MARLSISLLGPLHITLDGRPAGSFGYNKVRALLAYLAVEADRPHHRDTLVGLFWPDQPDKAARTNLRQALATLREALGDATSSPSFLLATRETVQFNSECDYDLDVAALETCLADCRSHQHRGLDRCRACAARMEQALARYRGDFLAQFSLPDSAPFEEWTLLKREQLRQAALEMLTHLAAHHERRGEHEPAQRYVRRQVELDPWREEAHRHLMRLWAVSGQRSAALAQFESCRGALAEGLGVEPASETVALYEQIKAGELETDSAKRAAPLLNWPHPATPLIGRDAELAELAELIANPGCRLVTILGPGGMGKTRLALEAAAGGAWSFADGGAFVSLAPLHSAEHLMPAIAHALGVALSGLTDPREQLIHALQGRELLIVLDNFEHLRDGAAALAELLARAPGLYFVVTSRQRLGMQGEWLFELRGLRYPNPQDAGRGAETYGAVDLFLQSARRTHLAFAPSESDMAAIIRICRMLGGMPLAIELAAMWTRALACTEIADEIEMGLGILSTALPNVSERHRSLRAVFERSWELLTPEEQTAFKGLSVFRGGFEREAAEQVAGVTRELLSALIDKSLLQWTYAQRYDQHELIGQFAVEKLRESGEEAALRVRHADYFLKLAENAEGELRGPEQNHWLERIEAELNNLRAALDWSLEQPEDARAEVGFRLVSALGGFWWMRDLSEGRAWLAALLQHSGGKQKSLARARALDLAGDLALEQVGDLDAARALYEESLSIQTDLGDKQGAAVSLLGLGATARAQGDLTAACSFFEQGLGMWRQTGQGWGIAWALHHLGNAHFLRGDLALASSLMNECLAIRRELGDKSGVAWASDLLGEIARFQGDYEQAAPRYEESLKLHRELDNKAGLAAVLSNLGYVALNRGDHPSARALFDESLSLSRELGHRYLIAAGLIGLAGLESQPKVAVRWLGAAEESRRLMGAPADKVAHERLMDVLRAQLDEAAFAAAWAEGQAMTLEQAVEQALEAEGFNQGARPARGL